mmetsp:Transcript_36387/g.62007  ORF Transcript_36387/g.62007 Transcript_36387/m.62007 type:complete len:387 (-) Transcript_36387:89-1249(-)|eukprot:CAMPEP_0183720330 /NCGR_PEP_ID=MMETSP0737-20130205/12969_1 /TAXON_ID=385413 /ORGANISM="Thalassiosira miniscula, Strain CCMP1093" /LENGTH=386 /DNA_ID=CAMNT_0025950175 /DNA_START=121 /DNA_END=1281 /DNA_ORIENTATION=-
MIASDNAKPPRPCTEYNIFFQLERAHILQVLFQNQPSIDPADVFHPSQPTYIGLPPLPFRYSSLVLPYDWHLPGKEKRRKRKHRKTHGVISFHDLSARVASAWKVVNKEVKTYCSQVCAAGMLRYKSELQEWKLRGGQHVQSRKNYREMMMAKISINESSMPKSTKSSAGKKEKKKPDVVLSDKCDMKFSPHHIYLQDMARHKMVIPTPVLSQSSALENNVFLGDSLVENVKDGFLGIWDSRQESLTNESIQAINPDVVHSNIDFQSDVQGKETVMRNASIVSNDVTVDIDDSEIFDMWNTFNNDNGAMFFDEFDSSSDNIPNTITHDVHNENEGNLQHDSITNIDGYTQMIEDAQRMKILLDRQVAVLDKVKQGTKRRSIVASSA